MKTCGRCGANLDSSERCTCEGLPTLDELVPYTPTTRRGYLVKLLEDLRSDLYDASANYMMTKPRRGREKNWQMALERYALVKTLLAELPNPAEPDGSRRYFGWVQSLPATGDTQFIVLGLETGEKGALVDTRLFVLPKKVCTDPASLEGKYVFVLADPHCEVTGIQVIELTEESA